MARFSIVREYMTHVRRLNVRGRKTEFNINPIPDNITNPLKWIEQGVAEVVRHATQDVHPDDMIGFTFCGESFKERGPGWIHFKPASEVKFEDVWTMLSKIFQSNTRGLSTDTFCLGTTTVRLPAGKGTGIKYNTFEEECGMRRGITTIKNKDNLCLPRALVVAMAQVTKDLDYRRVRRDIGKIQTTRARQLMEDAGGIVIPEGGAGLPELRQFQQHLADFKITVYRYGTKGRDVIYEGEHDKKYNINLLHHEGHYNVINSLTAAFCCIYYCDRCHVPYDHKNHHRCGGTCPGCQRSPKCSPDNPKIMCSDCNRGFRGQTCYDNHKTGGEKSLCCTVKRCTECFKTFSGKRKHTCGEIFCKVCEKHVAQPHLCYMRVDRRQPPKMEDTLFIFYDLETRQEKVIGEKKLSDGSLSDIKVHEPNLCVFTQRCGSCIDQPGDVIICSKCGVRQQVLYGAPHHRSYGIYS